MSKLIEELIGLKKQILFGAIGGILFLFIKTYVFDDLRGNYIYEEQCSVVDENIIEYCEAEDGSTEPCGYKCIRNETVKTPVSEYISKWFAKYCIIGGMCGLMYGVVWPNQSAKKVN